MRIKKMGKSLIAIILALAMIVTTLIITPMISHAASAVQDIEDDILEVWADCDNSITQEEFDAYNARTSKTTMAGAVVVHRRTSNTSTNTNNYYLFFPSTVDNGNLRMWYKDSSLSINGTSIENGGTTDVFKNLQPGSIQDFTFNVGGTSHTVKVMKSANVGTVYVDTESGSMTTINNSSDHSDYEGGTVMVVAPDGTVEYDGVLEKMQGRGNATWSAGGEKNPYNIKLGTSTSLLGMNKAKKWVLLANKFDPTLIRDQIGYDYSKFIGVKYQPICKPVDLYCNQIYMGSYQLSEKVEIKSNRIAVNDAYENLEIANGTVDTTTGLITPADFDVNKPTTNIYKSTGAVETSTIKATKCATVGNRKYSTGLNNPSDITGGYLYELEISERWINENAGFCGYNRQGWVVKSADYATKEMVDYSYDLLYALGSAVYNKGTVPSTETKTTSGATTSYGSGTPITNPAPAQQYQGKKWSDLLDAESAVKYFWIQEYFKNLDSSTSSTYFYKDCDRIDGKLYAGPVWDLDHSVETVIVDTGLSAAATLLGGRWGYKWNEATGWYARNVRIYMWNGSLGNERATTDKMSPLSFYGALYNNNSDFQQMFNKFWYTTMTKANKVLMGEETDSTGTLKSLDEYFEGVRYTGLMNNTRLGYTTSDKSYFNLSTLKSGVKTWFTNRNNWINQQIPQVSIDKVTVDSVPSQSYTGSPVEPKLTLTYGGVELEEGKDYTIVYSNNVNATSMALATITGLGYYTGSKSVPFVISSSTLGSAEIYESAYNNDLLTVNTKTTNGNEVNGGLSYQWRQNGKAIDGATDSTYQLTEADSGKTISVIVTGDGNNVTGSVQSNDCAVADTERPAGFSKTLASWDYDFTANADALTTSDETGATYYYNATSGEIKDKAELRASVNAKDIAKIKWSGSADLYVNDEGTVSPNQAPVMGTSKADLLAWGDKPYFESTISTLGYKSITYSAKLGGTKKAPASWKLQYSLDGVEFKDISEGTYKIVDNKTMEQAFTDVALPSECDNKAKVYIRAVVDEDIAINGVNTVVGQTSGDAAINNVKIKGESIAVITDLAAPTVMSNSNAGDGTLVFSTDEVEIKDNNGGAKLYYAVNDGEAQPYEAGFKVFDKTTAKIGDTAKVTAWSEAGSVRSEDTVATITFGGVNVNSFNYITYSQNVSNGAVFSTGGAYDESGKMTAYTDGVSQYVPMWNDGKGAFSIAPDDGALWTKNTGYYFEVPTAGYENIRFSARMYTTGMGPRSVSLQYSTDNESWTDLDNTVVLGANSELEQAYLTTQLPADCDNKAKIYVRVVTVENSTNQGDKLHNNMSKGNLYINNIVFSGEDNGDYKMPFTNKTTSYFGSNPIKYKNESKMDMQYVVLNPDGKMILNGTYPKDEYDENGILVNEGGIKITSAPDFYAKDTGEYTVSIWTGDDDDQSLVNTRKYCYKGDTVVKFSYTTTKRPIVNYYTDASHTAVNNTSGANAGTLAMYPNAVSPAVLDYSDVYGAKVAWSAVNPFVASKELDNPKDNGYWIIETSTKGYNSLTLTLGQISSNKGPRDWGIAYSLDGSTYTYVKDSNARAISNDASAAPVETYNNFALPSELNDKEKVYIKLFINGGESVDGAELETLLKGNTGINDIELCGIALPGDVEYTINTVAFEDSDCNVKGTQLVPSYITVDGETYPALNGKLVLTLTEGQNYQVVVSANDKGTFPRTASIKARDGGESTIAYIPFDVVADGVINAKDYAMISRDPNYSEYKAYMKQSISPFVNTYQE